MVRLIKIHEIEEFSEIISIPDSSISKEIIANVKKLDEKNEIECFIREIIHDPNETPHGPTEIADILTGHIHINGEKVLTAFVLKGKGLKKVSSQKVTHQFLKIRQINGLKLMVFGAVGNIQDDAQRDFMQAALDAGSDYLIIDTQDFARLFIAYEKICPKDGTPYDNMGVCRNRHERDEGLTLEMKVREEISYKIFKQKDVSHAGAKRYSAFILVDKHYPKDLIRTIIKEATEEIKHSNYYRNKKIQAKWGKISAHVVWLFIAHDLNDIQHANWICRTYWVDKLLPENMCPLGLDGNERIGDIEVSWNYNYKSYKKFFESSSGTKEEVLEAIDPILNEMIELAGKAINYFKSYKSGDISEDEFINKMQKKEPRANALIAKSGNIPMPPEDCKDYDQACQNILGTIHDMFIYYSKKGLKIWPKHNRDWLMQDTIKRFYDNQERIRFEGKKIH